MLQKTLRSLQCDIPDDVKLIAVSKRQSEHKIEAALAAGQRVFGENRLQEAQERWYEERRTTYPDLELHFIGQLQSKKAAEVVALFDYIHSVDRKSLCDALTKAMHVQNRYLPCFIQVNTGQETQKGGVSLDELQSFYSYVTEHCGLEIIGLMCLPPYGEPPKPHFKLLKDAALCLNLKALSMGMTGDYKEAIACGATHVRIGSGLFGQRKS